MNNYFDDKENGTYSGSNFTTRPAEPTNNEEGRRPAETPYAAQRQMRSMSTDTQPLDTESVRAAQREYERQNTEAARREAMRRKEEAIRQRAEEKKAEQNAKTAGRLTYTATGAQGAYRPNAGYNERYGSQGYRYDANAEQRARAMEAARYREAERRAKEQKKALKAQQKAMRKKTRRTVAVWVMVVCMFFAGLIGGLAGAFGVAHFYGGPLISQGGSQAVNVDDNSGSTITEATSGSVVATCMESVVCIYTKMENQGVWGTYSSEGAGSGVIVTEDGYIMTCSHVIADASEIIVLIGEDKEYVAKVIVDDPASDVALLKIEADGLTPAKINTNTADAVGDTVYVVGNPLGNFVLSVTQGIISGLDREIMIEDTVMNVIQVDAAINPGNSGGGLFNAKGELIGIVNAKQSSIEVEGMGFAIPINSATEKVRELLAKENIDIDFGN